MARLTRSSSLASALAALLLTARMFVGPAPVGAQVRVTGVVVEDLSRRPITDADVTLTNDRNEAVGRAMTDRGGRFTLLHPGAGTYVLSVDRIGYVNTFVTITLLDGTAADIDFTLSVQAVELDPVEVMTRRRQAAYSLGFEGFAARQTMSIGDFIPRAEIERRRPSQASDLMVGSMGTRVVQTPRGRDIVFLGSGPWGGGCAPAIWVDGVLRREGKDTSRTFDETAPPAAMIEGMEIYRRATGIPPQFNINAMCGVILIWTRR